MNKMKENAEGKGTTMSLAGTETEQTWDSVSDAVRRTRLLTVTG